MVENWKKYGNFQGILPPIEEVAVRKPYTGLWTDTEIDE